MKSLMRYCLPNVSGRGAGLGNELVPWTRAFLAAQVRGGRCLPPPFGLNQRRYWRHFGTPRSDWLQHRQLKKLLAVVEFREADYLRHIAQARDFVASQLCLSRFAAVKLLRLRQRLDPAKPIAGIHVRLGDFGAALQPHEYQSRFNVSLPLNWYRRVALSIHEQMHGQVQFLIVPDASPDKLKDLCDGLPCVLSGDIPDSDCSDLLALAQADLMVCSDSSFSVWAAFLSGRPYLWYGPNLHPHPVGYLSIWGHEAGQQKEGSPTRQVIAAAQAQTKAQLQASRASAVGHEGQVPAAALRQNGWASSTADTDLLQYGVIRAGASEEGVCT